MDSVLCAANASSMQFYFNNEDYGILPDEVKKELKVICVLFCADVGGIIVLRFTDKHKLEITVAKPIDEIGAELKIRKMQEEHQAFFAQLEAFSKEYDALRQQPNSGTL